ncbi:MAG: dihydrofolate reductase family protein [Ktedonobacteraceae bacterium]
MRKLVSEWMTLDGVFDADTMDQWWIPYDSVERQEYIKEGILECDIMLYGHTTYEMLAPYWSAQENDESGPAAKLNSVRKYVVSSSLKKAAWNNSTVIQGNIVEEIAKLKHLSDGAILIIGSAILVQSLVETDLIDEYRFLVQPIIIGSGKRFFNDVMHMTRLRLVSTKTYPKGVMLLTYQPIQE